MYFPPIKSDVPQLDFYTMYKRETVEYDAEYMQKYNEDLNTTLIFVRSSIPSSTHRVENILRPACSPPSAPPLSSTSGPSSSRTPANGLKPTSKPFSSASTDQSLQTNTLRLPQRGTAPLWILLRPRISCTRAF